MNLNRVACIQALMQVFFVKGVPMTLGLFFLCRLAWGPGHQLGRGLLTGRPRSSSRPARCRASRMVCCWAGM